LLTLLGCYFAHAEKTGRDFAFARGCLHVAGAMLVRAKKQLPRRMRLFSIGASALKDLTGPYGIAEVGGTALGQFAGELPEEPSLFDLKQDRRHARGQQIAKIFIPRDGQLLARQVELPFPQRH